MKNAGLLKRKPLKSRPITRFWAEALVKVHSEGGCRACGHNDATGYPLIEAAHTIGRKYDVVTRTLTGGKYITVDPDAVIPLCTTCHSLQEANRLSLLGLLTFSELRYAIRRIGAGRARRRLSGRRNV